MSAFSVGCRWTKVDCTQRPPPLHLADLCHPRCVWGCVVASMTLSPLRKRSQSRTPDLLGRVGGSGLESKTASPKAWVWVGLRDCPVARAALASLALATLSSYLTLLLASRMRVVRTPVDAGTGEVHMLA